MADAMQIVRDAAGIATKQDVANVIEDASELLQRAGTTWYVFLIKRPNDRDAWATIYYDRDLAEQAAGRCTDVVEVFIPHESMRTVQPRSE